MDNGFASPIVDAVAEPVLPAALADRARACYRRASKADANLIACQADRAAFKAWCAGHGNRPWPTSLETVARILAVEAEAGHLTTQTVGNDVKRYVAAGLNPTAFGTHSLRASYIT
ncbi:hypothetical protein [Methylorubrum extorquens]|uniref:hypothetical protein n=1 Tax=Methylorubrum extorquens TaxID=408 RepID=UPI001EE632C7|nr:hypothetical protein [Methylorubrum extorquens]MCG5244760.1 hypothetical protein [Methylorubrum extorquens]